MQLRLAALGLLVAACSTPAEQAGRVSEAIVSGAPSPEAQDLAVQIALALDGRVEAQCTGSLVAKNLVLTARHCVCNHDENTGRWGPSYDAAVFQIYVGTDAPRKLTSPAAAQAREVVTELAEIGADLAFLVLDHDVEAPVAKLRLASPVEVGETIALVGYGMIEDGGYSDYRHQRAGRVTAVAPSSSQFHALSEGEFVTTEGTCYGDSGGAVVSAKTGAVVGVIAEVLSAKWDGVHLSSNCIGAEAFHTALQPFRSLVDTAFTAAKATPQLEPADLPPPARTPSPTYVPSDDGGGGCAASTHESPGAAALLLLALVSAGGARRRARRA